MRREATCNISPDSRLMSSSHTTHPYRHRSTRSTPPVINLPEPPRTLLRDVASSRFFLYEWKCLRFIHADSTHSVEFQTKYLCRYELHAVKHHNNRRASRGSCCLYVWASLCTKSAMPPQNWRRRIISTHRFGATSAIELAHSMDSGYSHATRLHRAC